MKSAKEWSDLIIYIALATAGVGVGYLVGTSHSRRVQKRVLQKMNEQSLELLDAKGRLAKLDKFVIERSRRKRLQRLTLAKLQQANRDIKMLMRQQAARDKKAFIELSKMRMKAVQARESAVRATAIARKATVHLKRLELASPATQTIEAHPAKSYGSAEPVTVSVVDQGRLDGSADSVATVSNRDSVRLSRLHSSNEATAVR